MTATTPLPTTGTQPELGHETERWCYWAPVIYSGDRQVFISPGDRPDPEDCALLDPRHDLRNHSPDGFAWGYGGSGPAQLALAMCAHCTGDDDLAQRVYQGVKFKLIAHLPLNQPWTLSSRDVHRAIVACEVLREKGAWNA